jgi:DNA helicase MCM9
VQRVFEPCVSEEAEMLLQNYYHYLRMNPKVNKDRKTVRMLESLIRMSEAHARLLMKSAATVFDAVSVIILMEHTLMTDLYQGELLPSVLFESKEDYQVVRNDLFYKLGLDVNSLSYNDEEDSLKKRNRTPSPIKRIEDSLYLNNV